MKKITSLLMMFMLFVGMGWAQETVAPKNGVYKIFWQHDNRGYLTYAFGYHEDNDNGIYQNEAQLVDVKYTGCENKHFNSTNNGSVINSNWYVYTSEKGNTYIFSIQDGKFLGQSEPVKDVQNISFYSKLSSTPKAMKIYQHSVADHFYAQCGESILGSGCGSDKGNGHPVRWNVMGQLNDGGTPFKFVAVENVTIDPTILDNAVKAIIAAEPTPNIYFAETATGNTFSRVDLELTAGAIKDQLSTLYPFYTITKCTPEIYSTDVKDIQVEVTSAFPFATTTVENGHFANGTQWNYLNINKGKDIVFNKNGQITTIANTKAFNKESLWAFVKVSGNPYEFKIYNFENGANKPLGLNGEDAKFEGCNSNTDVFVLSPNNDGFALRCKSKSNGFLGSHRNFNGANSALGVWSGGYTTEDGSRFFATTLTEEDINNQLANLPSLTYVADAGENAVSTYTAEQAKTISDNKTQYATDKSMDALGILFEALEWTKGEINVNKFYQLISYDDSPTKGHPLYCDDHCDKDGGNTKYGVRKLYVGPHANLMNTAFRFEKDGQNYRVEHVNTKYWFADLGHFADLAALDLPTRRDWGGVSVIKNARNIANIWAISNTNGDKWIHSGGALVSGKDYSQAICRTQSPEDNQGNLWVIREITEVPVAVGAAKWSTLCLPMPVEVPQNADLHVYYVSEVQQGGAMVLTEIEAGTVIAKETPVLLYSTSSATCDNFTFQVNVVDQANSYADANQLSGATARRWGFNEGNVTEAANIATPYYALGNKDKKVAFYPSTSNTVPANKAYMLKSKVPTGINPTSLYFSFGDVTGIENAPVEESKDVKYYDLSGKRVLYPSNGVFITSEGKKVFIK